MKPREYVILRECVERGIHRGIAKSHKHHEAPDHDHMAMIIEGCVMNEIVEYFTFPEEAID